MAKNKDAKVNSGMAHLLSRTPTETPTLAQPVAGRDTRPDDPVSAVSLALRKSEWEFLQAYADERHASRGSLMTVLARFAIAELQAGRVPLAVKGLKFVSADESKRDN